MFLVHQMAKVASRSWFEAVGALPGTQPGRSLHCHYMLPENRARIAQAFALPAPRQTIANMVMPRNLLRAGAAAYAAWQSAKAQGQTVKVITGMRDPVARSISLVFFLADFYGHASRPLSPRARLAADDVIDALRETWSMLLENQEPTQSFEWLLWYMTGAYRHWFVDEFQPLYGIDILDPAQRGARLHAPGLDVLLYRVEDMRPSAGGHAALQVQAVEFLGAGFTGFPLVNTNATRRSSEISAAVQTRFRLPASMLDKIYDDASVRRFYGDQEIASFKRRWRAG